MPENNESDSMTKHFAFLGGFCALVWAASANMEAGAIAAAAFFGCLGGMFVAAVTRAVVKVIIVLLVIGITLARLSALFDALQ